MMIVATKNLNRACAVTVLAGALGMAASAALADDTWKPDPPDSYPPGWNVKSAPGPQAYDYKVGTGTMELAPTGQVAPPTIQNAQVIYQMVPGGLRYHRITQ
ncbi:MAG: hypothetical protein ACREFI_09710 [Stellaceae bacterium]